VLIINYINFEKGHIQFISNQQTKTYGVVI